MRITKNEIKSVQARFQIDNRVSGSNNSVVFNVYFKMNTTAGSGSAAPNFDELLAAPGDSVEIPEEQESWWRKMLGKVV